MGIRALYPGADPAAVVKSLVFMGAAREEDEKRRMEARRRIDIYNDDFEKYVTSIITDLFDAPTVRAEITRFVPIACVNSLLKRIVNDIARLIYASPPRRRFFKFAPSQDVELTPEQIAWNAQADEDERNYRLLAHEMGLDNVMDALTHTVTAVNDVLGFVRFIVGVGMSLDIIKPDNYWVIPHPSKPSISLAIGYGVERDTPGGKAKRWVVWDDFEHFDVDHAGDQVSPYIKHGLGLKPFVEIHRTARDESYFDRRSGKDMENGTILSSVITALVMKLHKWQGEKHVVALGHIGNQQVLDASMISQFPEVKSIVPIDLVTDPAHYLKTLEKIETVLAANYGISRERLNQGKGGDDASLRERTSAVMRVMRRAEADLVEILKAVSKQHPKYRVSENAEIAVDYPPVNARVDRSEQLENRQLERTMGLSSPIKEIREDNWELNSDEEAKALLDEYAQQFAEWIERHRALNIRTDGTSMQPGQDPVANGALGSKVRDGEMTSDEAAMMASGGADTDE